MQYDIVPNSPESIMTHGLNSDNSNSSEIPIQTNLISRPSTCPDDVSQSTHRILIDSEQFIEENGQSVIVDPSMLNNIIYEQNGTTYLIANGHPALHTLNIGNGHHTDNQNQSNSSSNICFISNGCIIQHGFDQNV